jgi:hypothetical protein
MRRATLGCHGAKPLILHRFYKQNEIACILLFGVLEGLRGALRQRRFASCFKTPAGINILPGNITFCSLAPVARQLYFWDERGLEGAQDAIFQNRENASKTKRNQSK